MRKYQYNINNLDCAHCAKKVEDLLNKNNDFNNVLVNFNTCKLSFESEKEFSINELNKIIKKIEPNAKISLDVEEKKEYYWIVLIIGTIIGLLGYFLPINNTFKLVLYIISYILLLYRVIINAFKKLIKSHTIDENLLITISCIGALVIGNFLEGMMVIILYSIGKILEGMALNNSRKSIKEIIDIKEPFANLKKENETIKIKVEDVKIGDILVIKKGEKIPVDGIILSSKAYLDMSNLTGESELVLVNKNDSILSGSINTSDVIEIKATNVFSDSTVSKILELLENATNKKAKVETLVSKISKIYVPTVLILAILTVILLPVLFNLSLSDSVYRALTFLVISCPCAIAISVPLSYFTAIGVSSKKGILIKGSNYLDNLSNVSQIVFDKTGTLTYGTYEVGDIIIDNENYQLDDVIDILRCGESLSNHPISKGIMKLSNKRINNKNVSNFKEITGSGITFTLNNDNISIGNNKLCKCKIDGDIHLHINSKHIALIKMNDGIKDNAFETIKKLKEKNIKTYMFTGDKKEIALDIGKKLNIDEIKYEMLPQDKYNYYEKISKDKLTMFVGDGVNDAPTIKRSDIGVSMGSIGSDSAILSSDIVIPSDDLSKIILSIDISNYTKKIIKENLIFAISTKILILILSILGLTNMWMAVFADTGVTLLTIISTLRIIRKFRN